MKAWVEWGTLVWVLELNWWILILIWIYTVCLMYTGSMMFFLLISCFVQSHNEMYSFKRPVDLSLMTTESGAHAFLRGGLRSSTPKQNNCVSLLSANQMVRALPPNKVPLKEVYPKGQSSTEREILFTAKRMCAMCKVLFSCLSLRCHTSDDSRIPGGDWPELQESQIYSSSKVKTTCLFRTASHSALRLEQEHHFACSSTS